MVTKFRKLEDSVCRDATPGAVTACDNEMGDLLRDVLSLAHFKNVRAGGLQRESQGLVASNIIQVLGNVV